MLKKMEISAERKEMVQEVQRGHEKAMMVLPPMTPFPTMTPDTCRWHTRRLPCGDACFKFQPAESVRSIVHICSHTRLLAISENPSTS